MPVRAVVEVRNALIEFLTFAQDEDTHRLPWQHHGLQRIREQVHVHDFDSLQRGNLVQVEIVGHHFCVVAFRELDQFHIDFLHLREVLLHHLHLQIRQLLNTLQNIQAAPAAVPLHAVRGIGHHL